MLTMQKTIYKHFFYNKILPEWPKLFCLMVMEDEISILARKHAEDIISAWNEFKEEKPVVCGDQENFWQVFKIAYIERLILREAEKETKWCCHVTSFKHKNEISYAEELSEAVSKRERKKFEKQFRSEEIKDFQEDQNYIIKKSREFDNLYRAKSSKLINQGNR